MKTNSLVYARTHSTTYVTDYILTSIRQIIVDLGLDVDSFDDEYRTFERGIRSWLESGHLEHATLEIYNPFTNALIGRFDFTIRYDWGVGDEIFWADKKLIQEALRKAGIKPRHAQWDIILFTKPGSPSIFGWEPCKYRSTEELDKKRIGIAVEHNSVRADLYSWRLR